MEGLQVAANASTNHIYFRARLVELSLSALPADAPQSQAGNAADLSSLFGPTSGQRRAATVLFDKVNERLQELLEGKGVQKLKNATSVEDPFSPEATSDRIISGIKGIFQAYQKQHSDMDPEELLSSFFEQAKKGVSQGYNQALGTLDDMGLLSVDGIKDKAQTTIDLVNSKLGEFESFLREQYGLAPKTVAETTAQTTQNEIVAAAQQTSKVTTQSGSLSLAV